MADAFPLAPLLGTPLGWCAVLMCGVLAVVLALLLEVMLAVFGVLVTFLIVFPSIWLVEPKTVVRAPSHSNPLHIVILPGCQQRCFQGDLK
jgi:uncharacterized membrane protein